MMWKIYFLLISLLIYTNGKNTEFPNDFLFGVSTASYQIEGAWNEDGKGESIWDNFTHKIPSTINNNENGDVACDSYHKYKEDVALAAELGVHFYRFSISWPRILPTGYADQINEKGIEFYNNLIAEILKHNMTPIATMYHWDLPQALAAIGWDNPDIIDIFVSYARIVIKNIPNVGLWITINEPKQICHFGYGDSLFAPGKNSSGLAEYQCAYVVLKAHAKTYHMYKKEFPDYTANMTMAIDFQWYDPLTNSTADRQAAERLINFEVGIYAHPLLVGDWPLDLRMRIYDRSIMEGYVESRLPEFTLQEITYIKGTLDLFVLNYYFTSIIENEPESDITFTSFNNDVRVKTSNPSGFNVGSNGYSIVPWGLTKTLKYIKDNFNDPVILISEFGVAENGTSLEDDIRIKYYEDHFKAILEAIYEHSVRVIGACAWSLLDNFEWASGYSNHFGFYSVNFNDPNRTRTPKKSVQHFKQMVTAKRLSTVDATGDSSKTKFNTYWFALIFILIKINYFWFI